MSDAKKNRTKKADQSVAAVEQIEKVDADLANATKAKVDRAKAERLKPVRFKLNPDDGGLIGADPTGDPYSHLRVMETFGVNHTDASDALLLSLISGFESGIRRKEIRLLNGAVALVHELAPTDAAEAMLCSQMVSTHVHAMDCLRRADFPEQTASGREACLRHAERLMRIHAQHLDALNKHRGKGQQKVTVEHVTVNAGGQAVVGNVER